METTERPLPKEGSRASTPTKKVSPNGTVDEPNRLSTSRASAVRPISEVSNSGIPSNFVKISTSNRKLTEASFPWSSLPLSLAKLGKVSFAPENFH